MLNQIPIVGWILDLVFKFSMAFPFWLIWSVGGIGAKYFYFLPTIYHDPGLLGTLGVFTCLGILIQFSPFRVSSSSDSNAAGPTTTS